MDNPNIDTAMELYEILRLKLPQVDYTTVAILVLGVCLKDLEDEISRGRP